MCAISEVIFCFSAFLFDSLPVASGQQLTSAYTDKCSRIGIPLHRLSPRRLQSISPKLTV